VSIDRRYLGWGVFLILLGGIPLVVHQGWIDRSIVVDAWRLWPLLLIGAGVGLVLSRTPFGALGGLIVSATFGIMLGGLVATGLNFDSFGCGGAAGQAARQVADQTGTFQGQAGSVRLELDCGELDVKAVDGGGWHVVATSTGTRAPQIDTAPSGLTVRSPGDGGFPFIDSTHETWTIDVPRGPHLDLGLTINAGTGRFTLDGASVDAVQLTANAAGQTVLDLEKAEVVGRLGVTVNAGDVRIVLPAAGTTGSVTANAGSVKLCAPAGTGLRLSRSGGFAASDNFGDRGLVQVGDSWETPGYSSASARNDIRATGNMASFELDPQGGCR
jgi:hypothetical protein